MVSLWWDPGIGDGDETGAESHHDEDRGEMEKRFLSIWKKNGVLCYCYWGFLFLYAIYRGLGYFVKHGKWVNDLEIIWFLGTGLLVIFTLLCGQWPGWFQRLYLVRIDESKGNKNGIPDKAIQLLEDRSRRSGNVVMKPFISFKPDAVDCCKGHKAFEIPCGSCIFDIQPN
ncbi:hypothetical protein F2Q68_00021935 [Brassica cretica]|uniref:Uncharacterized protein n=1 Tax=Brassica cretica TaxID=69181 RepID=A0A8S9FVH5_BRACR|nr:hypothetical protein F2Q68_00021935 [Brassica cretica]